MKKIRQIDAMAKALREAGHDVNEYDPIDNLLTFNASLEPYLDIGVEFDNPDDTDYEHLWSNTRFGIVTSLKKDLRKTYHVILKKLSAKDIIGTVCDDMTEMIIAQL